MVLDCDDDDDGEMILDVRRSGMITLCILSVA